jgi:NAD(P)-dependent dehydrogenase (short-subunit alcohol dehydrogenase family)
MSGHGPDAGGPTASGPGRGSAPDTAPAPDGSPMSMPIVDLKSPMDVTGKNVVVTGGAGGIGLGIARAFAQRGARVAILDVDTQRGATAARGLNDPAVGEGGHLFVECDISDRKAVRKAVDTVLQAFGRIDVLVNNAGISAVKPFLDMGEDLFEWHRVIDVNLHGTANMTHAVGNAMRASGRGGLMIIISSVGGATCSGSREMPMVGYVASKAALNHLTRSWAIEFAEHDIRVNCIMPGPTHSGLDAQLTPEMRERNTRSMLDRRWGEPLEIGALCVFLASPEGAHIDGIVVQHDGGFLCIN